MHINIMCELRTYINQKNSHVEMEEEEKMSEGSSRNIQVR